MGLRGTVCTALVVLGTHTTVLWGQPTDYAASRAADGQPDLNGIWQALNTANYDLQGHPARPAMALLPTPRSGEPPGTGRATPGALPAPAVRALGAVGGVPAGQGVVTGDEIPYQPWAAAQKQELSLIHISEPTRQY